MTTTPLLVKAIRQVAVVSVIGKLGHRLRQPEPHAIRGEELEDETDGSGIRIGWPVLNRREAPNAGDDSASDR